MQVEDGFGEPLLPVEKGLWRHRARSCRSCREVIEKKFISNNDRLGGEAFRQHQVVINKLGGGSRFSVSWRGPVFFRKENVDADGGCSGIADGFEQSGDESTRPGPLAVCLQARFINGDDDDLLERGGASGCFEEEIGGLIGQ